MQTVDARGYSCPEPVLMTMDAMAEFPGETIEVLVSSSSAKINVSEAVAKQGRTATVAEDGKDYRITIS